MVLSQFILFDDCQWHQFWLKFADKESAKLSASSHRPKIGMAWHQWATSRSQISHCNTTYQTHTEDI
jgi:hypothetical protein